MRSWLQVLRLDFLALHACPDFKSSVDEVTVGVDPECILHPLVGWCLVDILLACLVAFRQLQQQSYPEILETGLFVSVSLELLEDEVGVDDTRLDESPEHGPEPFRLVLAFATHRSAKSIASIDASLELVVEGEQLGQVVTAWSQLKGL
jgi:hypothetical protein